MNRQTTIAVALIIAGILYGLVSAARNQNPFYSSTGELLVPRDQQHRAWSWSPNPIWLPSFILCKAPRNGFGITHTRSGYLFRSDKNREIYFIGSAGVGGCIGALIALGVGITKRKQSVEPAGGAYVAPEAGAPSAHPSAAPQGFAPGRRRLRSTATLDIRGAFEPVQCDLPSQKLRTSPSAFLEQTQLACKHLLAGLEEYESLLAEMDTTLEPGSEDDLLRTAHHLRFTGTEVSRATLAGSLLQVAYSGVEAFSKNRERPDSCDAIVDPKNSRAVSFCIGRLVPAPQIVSSYALDTRARQIPLGIVVYAARNQYCHWHDIASKAADGAASPCNPVVMNVFSNLACAYYSHPFLDLAFDLGNPLPAPIFAYHVVRSVLDWHTYEDYSRDMHAMLCDPEREVQQD